MRLLTSLLILLLMVAAFPFDSFRFPIRADEPNPNNQPKPIWSRMADLGKQDPRLKGYRVPEGFRVEIVAEAPVVTNPVALTFATDGTPFVTEMHSTTLEPSGQHIENVVYRDGNTRKFTAFRKDNKDTIKTLRDSNNKGIWDQSDLVLQEESISSLLYHDGWLYVAGKGSIWRYRQSRFGGHHDKKEEIARGFVRDLPFQIRGMNIGPDGWLTISSSSGEHPVEGSDGTQAFSRESGSIFRCLPDGSKLELFSPTSQPPASNVTFDESGNGFLAEVNGKNNKKESLTLNHVSLNFLPMLPFSPKPTGGQHSFLSSALAILKLQSGNHGQYPFPIPPGIEHYNDTQLPEPYRGLIFYPDYQTRKIRAFRFEPEGSTFRVAEEFDLFTSSDPLFCPVQVVTGPDGALYIVDLHANISQQKPVGKDGSHGRIYRLSWAGMEDVPAIALRDRNSWQKIRDKKPEELLQSLSDPNATIRLEAQKALRKSGPEIRDSLIRLVQDSEKEDHARMAAMGVLPAFWNPEVQALFEEILLKGDANQRRISAQTLGTYATKGDREIQAILLKGLGDDDHAVRRAIFMAMGKINAPGAASALANSVLYDDGKDLHLRKGLISTLEMLGKPAIDQILILAESGVASDLDRVIDTIASMTSRPASEAIPQLLNNPHTAIPQRTRLILSRKQPYQTFPSSIDPLFDYLLANPNEAHAVKLAGLELIQESKLTPGPISSRWLISLLKDTDSGIRTGSLLAIGKFKLTQAGGRLMELVRDKTEPLPERKLAAIALIRMVIPDVIEDLYLDHS